MRLFQPLILPLISSSLVWGLAVPAPHPDLDAETRSIVARDGVTTLSSASFSAITPFAQFARAAYCSPSGISGWSCGDACSALPGFKVSLSGGDGNAIQNYFVGFWPSQNAIVVGHEGTDPTQFLSDLTDINFFLVDLDQNLFPGIDSAAQGHNGFLAEHAKTASTILGGVKQLLTSTGATTVITVGHSLGGALAELDALFLTLNLPSSVHIKSVTFGTPRVGNPEYAAFFDSRVADFERINNEKDPVPIVPGRALGFSHVHGEIHIVSPGNAVSCPGDDDATDSQCTIKTTPNILVSNILNHLGPYNGVMIGTIFCT
ncbi:alpha/beta-hydrolase [Irpex rosettiformis]|uniref:Alpha/beta-hydrolase n=1 Tax=Irpex rosettiformis TaxID=378272 RepID=A0ACB8TWV8_9APHY|nr:alpha/beta-hydrolase [Irpex rosettiformis]